MLKHVTACWCAAMCRTCSALPSIEHVHACIQKAIEDNIKMILSINFPLWNMSHGPASIINLQSAALGRSCEQLQSQYWWWIRIQLACSRKHGISLSICSVHGMGAGTKHPDEDMYVVRRTHCECSPVVAVQIRCNRSRPPTNSDYYY